MWRYLAFLAAMVLVAPLPTRIGYFVGRIIADLTYILDRNARMGVADNSRHALGPKATPGRVNHISLEVFRNTARNFYDLMNLPRFDSALVEKRLIVHGWDHFEQALSRGKGVILVSVHMGNMDISVQVIRARSVKLTILTEVVQPREYYELSRRLRASHGISLLPVTYSGLKEAIRRLRRGEVVAIASDRAIQGSGVEMDFFGEKALIPVGGVELALRTGAAIAPAFTVREKGDRCSFFFEPPIYLPKGGDRDSSIRSALARIVTHMEHYIGRYPDQWMVFESVWNGAESSLSRTANLGNGRREQLAGKSGRRHTTEDIARSGKLAASQDARLGI